MKIYAIDRHTGKKSPVSAAVFLADEEVKKMYKPMEVLNTIGYISTVNVFYQASDEADNYFKINCKLPSLNEYINKCRASCYGGGQFKKDMDKIIAAYIHTAVNEGTLHKTQWPVKIEIQWNEKTKRRDPDNVAGAKKYILDALQSCGVLENDNSKFVCGFTDNFNYGANEDGCTVILHEEAPYDL